MSRYPGGLIRKTPVIPAGPLQSGAAPGVWTLAEAAFWTKQGLWPTAGNVLAVEDVFSCFLYTGNGATQTITTGIDLAGKGGMLWIKNRSSNTNNIISDTVRGAGNFLMSNASSQQFFNTDNVSALSSTGFSVGVDSNTNGTPGDLYVSWTFREAPKFFDVVTYTGNGSVRTIAHNLGVAPGMIFIKSSSETSYWIVYHRSVGATKYLILSLTQAESPYSGYFNNTEPTASVFTLGNDQYDVNKIGTQYVAYLFAHDPSADGIIQCGSFTTDGSGQATVTLGYEPQWVLFKSSSTSDNWRIVDNMRGFANAGSSSDARLFPNLSSQEFFSDTANPTATGFVTQGDLQASQTYIYVAIRRGPMRTPTLGTSVFYPQTVAQANLVDSSGVPFPPDLVNTFSRDGTNRTSVYDNFLFVDRLRFLGVPSNTFGASTGGLMLASSSTAAELGGGSSYVQLKADSQNITRGTGWNDPQYGNWIYYFFRRAPGFMDVVCYTGTGSTRTVAHNLGVAPELMIVKRRNNNGDWVVYAAPLGATKNLYLSSSDGVFTNPFWNDTNPTSSVFTIGGGFPATNVSGSTYVSYLFASVPGVSKVGTYTGNGSSQTINCAFATGARFVMIKRTDSTGDWYVWDSARGIVAGNDPYLALNTTAAEVTSNDSVDTDSTGFIVNQVGASNININAATYIFLAIA